MFEIQVALVAALVLALFYYAVRSEWPKNYSTLGSTLELRVRGSLVRYLLFRALPGYVAALFVAVFVARHGGEPLRAVGVFAALHLLFTNGRAILRLLLGREGRDRRGSLAVFYLLTAVLIAVAALLGYFTHGALDGLVPASSEFVHALWTGLFAAIVAVVALRVTEHRALPAPDLNSVIKDVGAYNWDYAETVAEACDCDPAVLRAVVAAESVQRPRWMRTLENVKGRVVGPGTYGVAQVAARSPMGDRESLDKLAQSFRGYYPEHHPEHGYVLRERLAAKLEMHNRSSAFVEQALEFYDRLAPYPLYSSERISHDQRPTIEVVEIFREGDEWMISGTASIFEGTLSYVWKGRDEGDSGFTTASRGAPGRGTWKLSVPLEASSLFVFEVDENNGEVEEDQMLCVDLMR